MRALAPLLAVLLLPACATATSDSPQTAGSAGKCSAGALQSFVGRKATAATGAEILSKSGARTLRWGPPRSAMTMDYREDRLNVTYDDNMVIERVNCG